jgi:hypothetical protein
MKSVKTLAFRIEQEIAKLISEDAETQHSNESSVLRQIVHKHYEGDARLRKADGSSMLAPNLRQQTASSEVS